MTPPASKGATAPSGACSRSPMGATISSAWPPCHWPRKPSRTARKRTRSWRPNAPNCTSARTRSPIPAPTISAARRSIWTTERPLSGLRFDRNAVLRRGPSGGNSATQYRADRQVYLGRFDLGAVAKPEARHLDKPALGVDAKPLGPRGDDLAQFLPAHRAKCRRHDLFGVEQIELLLTAFVFERRPGARRRVAPSDQVVDEVDVIGPIDLGFRLAHPALVGRLLFVLGPFGGAARDHQIGGLQEGLDAEREDLVEIQ